MKKILKISNGILLILIGMLHTQFALSTAAFGKQFNEFAKVYFFKISRGLDDLPVVTGQTNLDGFAAFWFFYFGILVIPLGLLVHSVEKRINVLPHSFTISYFIVVAIGGYMIPRSGMTYIMLPHAVYMLVGNYLKYRKVAFQKDDSLYNK